MDELFDIERWSNIEFDAEDPEIKKIDQLEEIIPSINEDVEKVRDLIKHFEICHYKYIHHIELISRSIDSLTPAVEPATIGLQHPRPYDYDYKNAKNEHNKNGRKYISALKHWLNETAPDDPELILLYNSVCAKLPHRNTETVQYVQLLVVRLTWGWESLEEIQSAISESELTNQILRTDICHYNFPENLETLLSAIGQGEASPDFEGCSSCTGQRRPIPESEYRRLLEMCSNPMDLLNEGGEKLIRLWLRLSFAKVLKEQISLSEPISALDEIDLAAE